MLSACVAGRVTVAHTSSAAWSASSFVVSRVSESRIVARACSSDRPIARSTCEGSRAPDWQADPRLPPAPADRARSSTPRRPLQQSVDCSCSACVARARHARRHRAAREGSQLPRGRVGARVRAGHRRRAMPLPGMRPHPDPRGLPHFPCRRGAGAPAARRNAAGDSAVFRRT